MSKLPFEPDVIVRQRVDVELSTKEIEHALRCWVAHHLAPSRAPTPAQFAEIAVSFHANEGGVYGATLTYAPQPTTPEASHDR